MITIAVVGVVSVITLPVLTKQIQLVVLKSQAKKAYATIQQALLYLYQEDSGSFCYYASGYNDNCHDFFDRLATKMKLAKTCKNQAYKNGCVPNYNYLEPYSGNNCVYYKPNVVKSANTAYVLLDGTIIIPYGSSIWTRSDFLLDVNGAKKPNEIGLDIFLVNLTPPEKGDLPVIKDFTKCYHSSTRKLTDFIK